MPFGRLVAALGPCVVLALVATSPSHGAEPEASLWQQTPYGYVVLDQDVRVVLQEFGRNLGLVVRLSDAVQGRAQNLPRSGTARSFLDALATGQNLVWYDDGSVLHVAAASEIQSKVVPLNGASFEQVSAALEQLGLVGTRLGIRADADADVLCVTGPPDYEALFEQTIGMLAKPHPHQIRIFRGGEAPSPS